jgi:hypothetical protein
VRELLGPWNSFYAMIGSSAAALTGLMFVVITLVGSTRRPSTEAGISTFSTPTVFHFCGVLFTCAVMSAPLRSLPPVAVLLGVAGIAGLVYVVRVALRTSVLDTYRPDAEDWTWHVLLPAAAYVLLLAGALALRPAGTPALYAPAVAVTLLVFVGIHNAWDVVTFIAIGDGAGEAPEGAPGRID